LSFKDKNRGDPYVFLIVVMSFYRHLCISTLDRDDNNYFI
jgi:hypothetical protein